MNYLAHFFLNYPNPRLMAGDFLGDHIKGPLDGRFDAEITRAIHLHRFIDAFTDRHPVNQRAIRHLKLGFRRVGGIVLDLAYDHFLAKNWAKFSSVPLFSFIAFSYSVLTEHRSLFPEQLNRMVDRMIREDWMSAYPDCAGIKKIIHRVSGRLSQPEIMKGAEHEIDRLYDHWNKAFLEFFPQLIAGYEKKLQQL